MHDKFVPKPIYKKDMIESFKIIADVEKNSLILQLRGFFMKSEVELAFYLARKEIKKLEDGFTVILDLDGMHSNRSIYNTIQAKARRVFITLGASKVTSVGVVSRLGDVSPYDLDYFAFDNVGIYPN